MNRIGWSTYGMWKQVGEGFELIGDRGAELAAERHYRDWQGKEAAQAIATFRNRVLVQHRAPELSHWDAEQRGNAGPRPNRSCRVPG